MGETHTFRDDLSQPGKLRAIRIIVDNLCSLTKQQMVNVKWAKVSHIHIFIILKILKGHSKNR